MPGDDSDPSVVRSIAVTVEDALAAFEATRQTGTDTVLRVTPPFSGRMRARLHRLDGAEADAEGPLVYVRPADLLADEAPPYPRPDDTEDELRADPDVEYSREHHRERHAEAVATWREQAREYLVATAPLQAPAGPHEVEVVTLG